MVRRHAITENESREQQMGKREIETSQRLEHNTYTVAEEEKIMLGQSYFSMHFSRPKVLPRLFS